MGRSSIIISFLILSFCWNKPLNPSCFWIHHVSEYHLNICCLLLSTLSDLQNPAGVIFLVDKLPSVLELPLFPGASNITRQDTDLKQLWWTWEDTAIILATLNYSEHFLVKWCYRTMKAKNNSQQIRFFSLLLSVIISIGSVICYASLPSKACLFKRERGRNPL